MIPKVLIVAESCNPEWVSVPLVGWKHAEALSRRCGVHIATQVRNREAFLRAGLTEGADFTAIDSELAARLMWKVGERLRGGAGKGWTTLSAAMSVAYYYFEHVLWDQLGDRIAAREWDIVHRITPLSPTVPSLLAKKCARADVPFIMGPLNGGVPWPREFDAARRAEKEWLSYVRSAYKLLPGYGSTRKHSSAIIVGSKDTWALEPKRYEAKLRYIPENAVDPSRFTVVRSHRAKLPLRIAFVGRLVPYKGCDMLLEAAAPLIRAGQLTVEVIGDGPQRAELDAIVAREGIGAGVTMAGWVAHADLQHRLSKCDLFGFPSIREFGGGVVLEAMAVGLVPIVVRYGGPGELVTHDTGFLLKIASRSSIVSELRTVLEKLVAQPEVIEPLSMAAREHVLTHFTWDAKATQTLAIYREVLTARDRRSDKTDSKSPPTAPTAA